METEKFKKELAYVLKKIKECSDYALEDQPVEYKIYTKVMSVGVGYPTTENEKKLLAKLIEWKTIESTGEGGADVEHQALILPLRILQPKFDEIYQKYTSTKIRSNDYFVGEKELIEKITTIDRFKQARSKWSIVKDIVDVIYALFPPFEIKRRVSQKSTILSENEIELANANYGYEVFLDPNTLSSEQQAYFKEILTHLWRDVGVVSFTNYERVVMTSRPVREFFNGHILIQNRGKFEEYHQALSDFYNSIELTGKQKFPDIYKTPVAEGEATTLDRSNHNDSARILSNTDKKKLYVLEKLKDEYDLTPNEARISPKKHAQWIREGNITDYYEFEAVLNNLKKEGLIISFDFLSEYK
jgi:hypothetical protein